MFKNTHNQEIITKFQILMISEKKEGEGPIAGFQGSGNDLFQNLVGKHITIYFIFV